MLEKEWHLRSLQEKLCPENGVCVPKGQKEEVMILVVKCGVCG